LKKKRKRSLLLISYDYPPTFTATSLRACFISRELAALSWDIFVLAARFRKNADIRGEIVTKGIKNIHRTRRGLLNDIWPANIGRNSEWMFFALPIAIWKIITRKMGVVYTIGYPFISHGIGYVLKKLFPRVIWSVDFVDPWAFHPARDQRVFSTKIIRKVEEKILALADIIIVNTNATKTLYLDRYSYLPIEDKIKMIPMGYDKATFASSDEHMIQYSSLKEEFSICFIGTIQGNQNIRPFIEALNGIMTRNIPVKIYWAGGFSNDSGKQVARQLLEIPIVKYWPFLSLAEGWAVMRSGRILLLPMHTGIQVPAKIYQYLATDRPILVLKETEADEGAYMVERYSRGLAIMNTASEIMQAIVKLYTLWKDQELEKTFIPCRVEQFSWENISKELNQVINETYIKNRNLA